MVVLPALGVGDGPFAIALLDGFDDPPKKT